MYRLNQADKLYDYGPNKGRGGRYSARNMETIGEYSTVKEAALKLKDLRKMYPDKVFYIVSAWNKHKGKKK